VRSVSGGKIAADNPPFSRHARYYVGVKRRLSLPPRPSFPTHMIQGTGKRPNGAAAAIHTVYGPQGIRVDLYEGIPRLGLAAVDTSYVIVRASFSSIRHSKRSIQAIRKAEIFAPTCVRTTSTFLSHRRSKLLSHIRRLVFRALGY